MKKKSYDKPAYSAPQIHNHFHLKGGRSLGEFKIQTKNFKKTEAKLS